MKPIRLTALLRRLAGPAMAGALVFALLGCDTTTGVGPGPGPIGGSLPIAANVVVLDDPVGGRGTTELACTFGATQVGTDGDLPVQIRVDWVAPCGTHKTETFTFRGGEQAFTSTYADPTGYPISMTFWASITWTDSRGKHVVRSASAAPGA